MKKFKPGDLVRFTQQKIYVPPNGHISNPPVGTAGIVRPWDDDVGHDISGKYYCVEWFVRPVVGSFYADYHEDEIELVEQEGEDQLCLPFN